MTNSMSSTVLTSYVKDALSTARELGLYDMPYMAFGIEDAHSIPIVMPDDSMASLWHRVQHEVRWTNSYGEPNLTWVLVTPSRVKAAVIPGDATRTIALFPEFSKRVINRCFEDKMTIDECAEELKFTAHWFELS